MQSVTSIDHCSFLLVGTQKHWMLKRAYLWLTCNGYPFLYHEVDSTGQPTTEHVKTACLFKSITCVAGSTFTPKGDRTVRLTSTLSEPTVLFTIQTYTPESSTVSSCRINTSRWYFIFGVGKTCRRPTPSTRNHLQQKINSIT